MDNNIRLLIPDMPNVNDLLKYLADIDANKTYSNFGPLHVRLTEVLAHYFDVEPSCLSLCSNATLALIGALKTIPKDVKPKTLSLPSWTFAATGVAAANCFEKERLSFVDVDLNWRSSLSNIGESHLDVLPFGDAPEFSRYQLGDVPFVIDAAASFDALRNMKLPEVGTLGVVVSLHATKLIGAGEGGVFISNNPDWVTDFRSWTNFGFAGNRESSFIGSNAKLSEYSAAVALASFDRWVEVRRKLADNMSTAKHISDTLNFKVHPAMRDGHITPYWIIEMSDPFQLKIVKKRLDSSGIENRHWWGSGLHTMPAFKDICHDSLEVTSRLSQTTLGLPFHSKLSKFDFERIFDVLEKI